MNETRIFDGLGQVDPSRFVKSDDNVGLQARCASAPTNGARASVIAPRQLEEQ